MVRDRFAEQTRPVVFAYLSRFRRKEPAAAPTVGTRLVYAVGDIHGRADLLSHLITTIIEDADILAPDATPALVFLGDYVDRGPESRSVLDQVIALADCGLFEIRALKGNHEDALFSFLESAGFGATWEDFGGRETLMSYGVTPPRIGAPIEEWEQTRAAFDAALPREHRAFLSGLEMMAVYGDYAFVHAGVRPGVSLEKQSERDLLWIRDDFLRAKGPFDKVIVHGHTPEPEPYLGRFRIGIDTGAYATGALTAVRLSGTEQTILQATAAKD